MKTSSSMIPAAAGTRERCFPNRLPPLPPRSKSLAAPKSVHDEVFEESHDEINGVKITEYEFKSFMLPITTETSAGSLNQQPESRLQQPSNFDVEVQEAIDSVFSVKITGDHVVGETRILDSSDGTKIFDINAGEKNPLLCSDIANDMFKNLRLIEMKKRPKTNYMEKLQKHINPRTRARCVDWLVAAAEKLCSFPETLHLAINCLDRYLSGNNIDQDQFHFIGLTCMMIAFKYEEERRYYLNFDAYSSLTMNSFSRGDFIRMERLILRYLEYNVTVPTTWTFLEMFILAAQDGKKAAMQRRLECMASYIAELSLLSYSMLRFLPSLMAASSVFLAQYVLDPSKKPWNATLQQCTTYMPSDLQECVLALYLFCFNSSSSKMPAIRMKYSQQKYEYVASKISPSSIPPEVFQDLSC